MIDGEAVVVTPKSSEVHELDAVATFVWERCDGRRTGWQLVAELVEAFEVERDQAAADVSALLNDLALKGIIEWHEVALPKAAP